MNPIDLKVVAKRFTEKYYPQFLHRVDRIWDMFEKIDINSFVSKSGKYQLGNAFGIAGTAEPIFQEYMKVISILAYVNPSVKGKDGIDKNEIIIQLTSAPKGIKLSTIQQQKLEDFFSEILHSPDQESVVIKKKKIINFTETTVLFPEGHTQNKTYPWKLYENIILKGEIHWLWGFVILNKWSSVDEIKSDPKGQFANYISKEKRLTQEYGFGIEEERDSGKWILNWDMTINDIECNLLDARLLYTKALDEFEGGNFTKAIEFLESAISPDFYQNIKYIDAYNLLSKCIIEVNYNVSDKLLSKIENFYSWYKRSLKNAIGVIDNIYLKKAIISKIAIEDPLKFIKNEYKYTVKNHEAIANKSKNAKAEKDFDEFLDLYQYLREKLFEILEVNPIKREDIDRFAEYNKFKNSKIIQDIFILKATELNSLEVYRIDKEETEKYFLLEIIQQGIDFDKCTDLSSLKMFLNNMLKSEIKKRKPH